MEAQEQLRISQSKGTPILIDGFATQLTKTRRKLPPISQVIQLPGPSPELVATLAKVEQWQAQLDHKEITRAELSQQEGISRARVTQLMHLARLPDTIKSQIREQSTAVSGWSIRRAISAK